MNVSECVCLNILWSSLVHIACVTVFFFCYCFIFFYMFFFIFLVDLQCQCCIDLISYYNLLYQCCMYIIRISKINLLVLVITFSVFSLSDSQPLDVVNDLH